MNDWDQDPELAKVPPGLPDAPPRGRGMKREQLKCLEAVRSSGRPLGHRDETLREFHKEKRHGYDTIGECLRDGLLEWNAKADILSLTDEGRLAISLEQSGSGK